jgi:hypothetical protein
MHRYPAKLIVAAMASAAFGTTAIAQTAASDPAAPGNSNAAALSQTISVGEQEIRSFALALVELDKIQRQYVPQIQSVEAAERPQFEQEMAEKMVNAVEEQGLDPQTFNAISATAQENPELEGKIRAEIAKVQPEAPTGR